MLGNVPGARQAREISALPSPLVSHPSAGLVSESCAQRPGGATVRALACTAVSRGWVGLVVGVARGPPTRLFVMENHAATRRPSRLRGPASSRALRAPARLGACVRRCAGTGRAPCSARRRAAPWARPPRTARRWPAPAPARRTCRRSKPGGTCSGEADAAEPSASRARPGRPAGAALPLPAVTACDSVWTARARGHRRASAPGAARNTAAAAAIQTLARGARACAPAGSVQGQAGAAAGAPMKRAGGGGAVREIGRAHV